jgi:hypothetical protein
VSTAVTDTWQPLPYTCDRCGAGLAFHGVRTEICPYCASPNFLARAPAADVHRQPTPAFVLPFLGDAVWAHRHLQRWLGTRWFADAALVRARVQEIRGLYLPAYMYSAVARTSFTAQIGEHYTEVEEAVTLDIDGKGTRDRRTVTRTEYRPLAGQHVGYVTDLLISASAALPQRELARVEPFDLRDLRRFAPAFVTGFVHEEFAQGAAECRRASAHEAKHQIGAKLRRFLPGEGFSDLDWSTRLEWESLDPILVPVWIFVVRYRADKAPLRIVVNGQSGRVGGDLPWSWWKLGAAALVLVAIGLAIAWWLHAGRPA